MSVNFNKVMLMGNLVRDPALRATPSGRSVGDMRVAVNRHFKDSSGGLQKEVLFITTVVWEKLADNCKKFLTKGSPVFIEGHLFQDSWEKDGVTRTEIKVVAEKVIFLPSGSRMANQAPDNDEGYEKTENHNESADPDEPMPDDDLPF